MHWQNPLDPPVKVKEKNKTKEEKGLELTASGFCPIVLGRRTEKKRRGYFMKPAVTDVTRLLKNIIAFSFLFYASAASAQIGGQTAADGNFVLDDVEVLNLVAEGVERNWIPDYVWGVAEPLQAVPLSGSGLILASGQSPNGALQFTIPSWYGYVDKGFGVPMPGVKGASSLDYPGDITSFTHLSFFFRYAPAMANQKLMVILETYPGGPEIFPKLYWIFNVSAGNRFYEVKVDLRAPQHVQDSGSLTIEQMLSKTRYLAFYFYGEAGPIPTTMEVHVDDIKLIGTETLPAQPESWMIF